MNFSFLLCLFLVSFYPCHNPGSLAITPQSWYQCMQTEATWRTAKFIAAVWLCLAAVPYHPHWGTPMIRLCTHGQQALFYVKIPISQTSGSKTYLPPPGLLAFLFLFCLISPKNLKLSISSKLRMVSHPEWVRSWALQLTCGPRYSNHLCTLKKKNHFPRKIRSISVPIDLSQSREMNKLVAWKRYKDSLLICQKFQRLLKRKWNSCIKYSYIFRT